MIRTFYIDSELNIDQRGRKKEKTDNRNKFIIKSCNVKWVMTNDYKSSGRSSAEMMVLLASIRDV